MMQKQLWYLWLLYKNTYVTFTEEIPSIEDYAKLIIKTQKEYPYIVACDDKGTVIEMAYADRIRHHDAYKFSVEVVLIYLLML